MVECRWAVIAQPTPRIDQQRSRIARTRSVDRTLPVRLRNQETNMELVLAVPYTHVFLAAVVAYGLPDKLPECKMIWQDYETAITKQVHTDKVVVVFKVEDDLTRYEFNGSKLVVSSPATGADGKSATAKANYDLEKVFGVREPAAWGTAKRVVLTGKAKKSVTLKLSREEKAVKVVEVEGDSQAVFGFLDEKFPTATIRWK
jgi:hypothetical protein